MIKLNSAVSAMFLGVAALTLGACASTQETSAPATMTEPEPVQEARPMQEIPAERPAPPPAPMDSPTYYVVRGDHLWGIASKPSIYGNPYQWPLIYRSNSDKIRDADLIFPGQVFTINQDASGSDIDAAVRHARTRGAWSIGEIEESDSAYLAR